MKTVWKYAIPMEHDFEIEMPQGSRTLCFQMQGVIPTIWVLVNPDADPRPCRYHLRGTGQPIDNGDYVGTVQMYGGDLVWHLFVEAF